MLLAPRFERPLSVLVRIRGGRPSSSRPRARLALAARCAAIVCAAGLLAGCGGKRPDAVGLGPLAPCPPTPNCVSSLAPVDSRARVAPIFVTGDPVAAWAAAVQEVADGARTEIVAEAPGAIHAEVKTALFRFVDDLELRLDASERRIDMRSASRVGRSDLGVNRRRVEALRAALVERGLVRTEPSEPSEPPEPLDASAELERP